jgi:hypothetical protein
MDREQAGFRRHRVCAARCRVLRDVNRRTANVIARRGGGPQQLEDSLRRSLLIAVTVVGVAVPLSAGTALAMADDAPQRRGTSAGFEIEIDPELDAKFGPRPVNAVQAAAIVTQRFPGARVLEAELDERAGGPIWDMEFQLRGDEREVEVDAVTGAISGDGADEDRDDDDERDDD